MLKTLHVRNIGVLGDVEVDFPDGLSVLTGETGAGKSLLVGAIKLLLGARADASDIRAGESMALVEAVFECAPGSPLSPVLAAAGYPESDSGPGEVHVRRTVSSDGRSKGYINGSLASAKDLRDLMGMLVSVAGQHAFIGLGIPSERLAMLDAFAGVSAESGGCRQAFEAWHAARSRLDELVRDENGRESRRDYLYHVISQIESVNPAPGDTGRMQAEAVVLRGAGRLIELSVSATDNLYEGQPSAYEMLSHVESSLRDMAVIDKSLATMVERLDSVRIDVRELARELTAYGESVDLDPQRLATVEARLDALHDLSRKYGGNDEAVIETLRKCRAELETISGEAGEKDALVAKVDELKAAWEKIASGMSAARQAAAAVLGREVTTSVRGLAMEGATMRIDVLPCEPSATGRDRVEFQIETNPGEGFGPVADVASGGELSRITLGLYSVMSGSVGTPVMVYDEIDAGVSGGVAEQMGKVLQLAARGRQVLVVTHHGQVAACGDAHFKVDKKVFDGRTVASVHRLDERARVEEIARIIGGMVVTDKAREHAGEMLGARDEGLLL